MPSSEDLELILAIATNVASYETKTLSLSGIKQYVGRLAEEERKVTEHDDTML